MLPACLASIHQAAQQCHLDYELIVVNDSSTDATEQMALAHNARVLFVTQKHIAATRNAGAQAALGTVLIFVDADTHISAALVSAAISALNQGAIGGGAAVRLHGTPKWGERVAVRFASWGFRMTGIAPGCFIYCTKDAFTAVGGFDQTLFAAEDVAISHALARHGRFTILREWASTSDRKMRTHGVWDRVKLFGRFARRGWSVLKDRDDLGLWYGDRRDP